MVKASNDFKTVTRNSSQFKAISPELLNTESNQENQGSEALLESPLHAHTWFESSDGTIKKIKSTKETTF